MLVLLYLLTSIAIAGAATDPSVRVVLSVPNAVDRIDTFKVTTTITNEGDKPIKLLRHPHSPLSDIPTDKFSINSVHHNHVSPEFIGISARYVSTTALATSGDSAIQTLNPKEFIEVHHPIFEAYDFSTSGSGQYLIMLKNLNTLYYVSDDQTVHTTNGETRQAAFTINIDGSLMPQLRAARVASKQRIENQKCTKYQEKAIDNAFSVAADYIKTANEKLDKHGYDSEEYKRWFGAPGKERLSIVKSAFRAWKDVKLKNKITYTCASTFCSHPGMYAYVYFDSRLNKQVNFCEKFFDASLGGYNSRPSTVVHEALQLKDAGEYTHDKESVESLARKNPSLAVKNAENLEYFAAAVYGEAGFQVGEVYSGGKDRDAL